MSEHAALPVTRWSPNLHRYGRRHKASNFGVAEFTTVILYGSNATSLRSRPYYFSTFTFRYHYY